MADIINQRQIHLEKVKERARQFRALVIEQYNQGISAREIAKLHINPVTGKHYSWQHIQDIVKQAREETQAPN